MLLYFSAGKTKTFCHDEKRALDQDFGYLTALVADN